MKLTERQVIDMARDVYSHRVRTFLNELDVVDKNGTVLLSPGLKVRHKDSNFEYTIDDVLVGDDGKIKVQLNVPEKGRFSVDDKKIKDVASIEKEPEAEFAEKPTKEEVDQSVLGEDNDYDYPYSPMDQDILSIGDLKIGLDPIDHNPDDEGGKNLTQDAEPDVFIVDQTEFEREYEI